MENKMVNKDEEFVEMPIVIADECGDSLWDAVLQQELKVGEEKPLSKNATALLNRINSAQTGNTTTA